MTVPYWSSGLNRTLPFSFENVYRFPKVELDQLERPPVQTRVGIIGGGVAGLSAAYELGKLGYEVEVLEQSPRIGGRIRTARFHDGSHVELGAMRIPGNHACTLHYVDEFGLQRRPFVNYNSNAFLHLRGFTTRLAEWRTIAQRYDLAAGELGRDPGRLLEQEMERALARLSSEEKYQLFYARTPGIVEEYDRRTLRQHLEAGFLSSEAIEFLGHSTGLLQYERASFLETLIDYFGLLRVDQFELVDGMEALVDAIAGRLPDGVVQLETSVRAVRIDGTGAHVSVHRAGGENEELTFDFVLCTVPARSTAMIEWAPKLDQPKREACQRLYYASAAKTVLHVSKRLWETEQGIFGGGSFSDELFQQCWYPSDNAIPAAGQPLHAVITGDDEEDAATSAAPGSWVAGDPTVSEGPGVLTASYTWENNARAMASLSEEERTRIVLGSLERLHPGLSNVVTDVRHVVWDDEPGTGGGAFAYYAPGEHGRYLEALGEAHPAHAPRVFFAGEHVSVVHAWIQGAVQSSMQAVLDLAAAARAGWAPVPGAAGRVER